MNRNLLMQEIKKFEDIELFSHILTEFRKDIFSDDSIFLTESHGYYNETENIVNYLLGIINEELCQFCKSPEKNKILTINQNKINNCFFEEIYVEISLTKGEGKKYSASDFIEKMFYHKDGKLQIRPYIKMRIQTDSFQDFKYVISFVLAHELTHCYNSYIFWKKTKKILNNEYIESIGYPKKTRTNTSFNQQAIRSVLYRLHRLERNAYIAQIKQELLQYKDEINDAQSGLNALKKTESYERDFKNIEENILNILSLPFSDSEQNEIMETVNEIAKKNFTTFEQCKKYFWNKWEKWKRKFMQQSSKIIYDIYLMNIQNNIIDTSQTPIIKPNH